MSAQQTFDGVGQVLRLQIGELALLGTDLHVENVVVDLRNQALQGNATLDTGGSHQRGRDVAWIDEGVGSRGGRNGRFLEEARWVARGWNLLDALRRTGHGGERCR